METETHPLWDRWSGFIIRRPRLIVGACLVVCGALGIVAIMTPVDLAFTGLLPNDDPEIQAYRRALETFGAGTMVLLLLEGEPAAVNAAAARVVERLPDRAPIATITPPADPQWLLDRAPWLWPDPLLDRVVEAVRAGEANPRIARDVSVADNIIHARVRPSLKAAIIGMELPGGPLDMAMGGRDFARIDAATRAILAELDSPIEPQFTGLAAVGAQDQAEVFSRIKILTPLTLFLVLALLWTVERRLSRVALAGVALAGSVGIAFGMVGLVQGRISIIVTFFGMLLLGLGIDFGIHLLVSLRDGLAHGKRPAESVRYGIGHTGTAIALGGVSTALAFGVLVLVPEPAARDMGTAALFGLLAAGVLMLSFLPAAWLLLEQRREGEHQAPRFTLPGLHGVVGFSLAHPWIVLGVAALITVWGAAGIPRYHLESDLSKIISRDVPALEVEKRLEEIYGRSPMVYLAEVPDIETARDWAAELRRVGGISQVTSAADIVTQNAVEKTAMLREALAAAPQDEATAELRARLTTALDAGPITLEDLPRAYTLGTVGKNGELALSIAPKATTLDARALQEQIAAVREIAPTATGTPVMVKLGAMGRRDYVPIVLPAIFVVVVVVLTVAFRDWRDILLGLFPVIVGTALAFGVFFWFDLQFSVLTGFVVPVILGLGVDNGIHVVARLRQYRDRSEAAIHTAVEGVGRAIFLTTATTTLSFVSLLLSNHAGMESIAWFMLLGVPACFVASVTVLPAAAKVLGGRIIDLVDARNES